MGWESLAKRNLTRISALVLPRTSIAMGSYFSKSTESNAENRPPTSIPETNSGPPALPLELLLSIASTIPADKRTISRLSAMSFSCRALLSPVLYREMTIFNKLGSDRTWKRVMRAGNLSRFESTRSLDIGSGNKELVKALMDYNVNWTGLERLKIVVPDEVGRLRWFWHALAALTKLNHLEIDFGHGRQAPDLSGARMPPNLKTLHIEGRRWFAGAGEPHSGPWFVSQSTTLESWTLSTSSIPDFSPYPSVVSKLSSVSVLNLTVMEDDPLSALFLNPEFRPRKFRYDAYYLDGRSRGTWKAICGVSSIERLELVNVRTDHLLEITRFPDGLAELVLERAYLSLSSWQIEKWARMMDNRPMGLKVTLVEPQEWSGGKDAKAELERWQGFEGVEVLRSAV